MTAPPLMWTVHKVDSQKFPYWIQIKRGQRVLLSLFTNGKWPGQEGNLFCLREIEYSKILEEIESIPVLSYRKFGRKLSIALNRHRNKRCDFLILEKISKTGKMWEQIYFQSEAAKNVKRSKAKLSVAKRKNKLNILIAKEEKYAWKFPGENIQKTTLEAGDYALKVEEGILAVVERKSFDNMLSDFRDLSNLHRKLADLNNYRYKALVIEANYQDFLLDSKLKYYSSKFASIALAEISAFHPGLQIQFAGSRKLAQHWVRLYFHSIQGDYEQRHQAKLPGVESAPSLTKPDSEKLRQFLLEEITDTFSINELEQHFPQQSKKWLRNQIYKFKERGLVELEKGGRNATWKVVRCPHREAQSSV